jgi:hypothetical protein
MIAAMTTWEYVVVEWNIKATPDEGIVVPGWTYEWAWSAMYGEGRREELGANELGLDTVLNRMGATGWELVSEVVYERAAGRSRGYDHAGFPICIRYTMKRPAAA